MDKLDAGRLKAAVFDWDGTLAETRTPRLWAVNRIMAKYGLPDWESTREKQNKLLSFMDNFRWCLAAGRKRLTVNMPNFTKPTWRG